MDQILLYLSLKYNGLWMAIYNSLQKKEQLSLRDVTRLTNEVNCDFITLINNKYVPNLKTINKPPFGIFCYGNYNLLNQRCVTVFSDSSSIDFIDVIKQQEINFLWVNLTNKELINVLSKYQGNNIFYMSEIKNIDNKIYQNLLNDKLILSNNAFISEIWERNNTIDYTNQLQERMFLGITKQVIILKKLKSKQLYSLAIYAKHEDIKILILKKYYDARFKKIIDKKRIFIFDDAASLKSYFLA